MKKIALLSSALALVSSGAWAQCNATLCNNGFAVTSSGYIVSSPCNPCVTYPEYKRSVRENLELLYKQAIDANTAAEKEWFGSGKALSESREKVKAYKALLNSVSIE